jgi:triacylglycerol lipase
MIALCLLGLAWATDAYDPTSPVRLFDGEETFTADGTAQLWSAVERHLDTKPRLFGEQDFNEGTEWRADDSFAPFIQRCFGTSRPASGAFLLHRGLGADVLPGVPVLFVPGAGDNASRGFGTLSLAMFNRFFPVYGLTFSHPHGDVFQQAEVIADAVARIKELTGAPQVDIVAHSKGGIAAAVYLSNLPGTVWGDADYEAVGTRYRGDVRRVVFAATPLGGVDTSFRWPANNYASLDPDTAVSPSSWDDWYPNTTGVPLTRVSLSAQDFYPGGSADLFPGQRQLLHPQAPALPGSMPWLGTYALVQQDWYTTWHGGYGLVSYSRGIEEAAEAGGGLIARLPELGVHPDVELFLLAGTNPLLTNGTELIAAQAFGETFVDLATAGTSLWASLMADVVRHTMGDLDVHPADVEGLASGKLVLGEVTAESDGVVFVQSATHAAALTGRGAQVVETRVVDLSHLDLLYASTITGQLILDQIADDEAEYGWAEGVAERYIEADTIGWIAEVLRSGEGTPGTPDEEPGADTDAAVDSEPGLDTDGEDTDLDAGTGLRPLLGGGCACGSSGTGSPALLVLVALLGLRRRR